MTKSHLQGLQSELSVALFLAKKGWILCAHRFKNRFAEIDLIFQEPGPVRLFHLVEVKTCQMTQWQEHRISARQRTRLLRSRDYLENLWRARVALHLAVVSHQGEVIIHEDIYS
jgi:Holliday junction resolvase-like predicted endonuclease